MLVFKDNIILRSKSVSVLENEIVFGTMLRT